MLNKSEALQRVAEMLETPNDSVVGFATGAAELFGRGEITAETQIEIQGYNRELEYTGLWSVAEQVLLMLLLSEADK